MQLTASRQSYDISKPMNSKQPKTTPDQQNNSFTPTFHKCKPPTANTDQDENTGPHGAPYGEAAHAPGKPARQNLLSELPTIDSGPRTYSAPNNTATKSFPPESLCPQLPTDWQQSPARDDSLAVSGTGTTGRIHKQPHTPYPAPQILSMLLNPTLITPKMQSGTWK